MGTQRTAAVVAISCRPNSGSEFGIGWNYLRMISQIFDHVTLFVRDADDQVPQIARQFAEDGTINVEIVPIPDLWIVALFKFRPTFLRHFIIYYLIWLWYVFFFIGARRTWRTCDFLFHVTWTSDWIFSPLFLLPFRKKIFGPAGSQPANFNKKSLDYFASRLRLAIKTTLRICSPNWVNALRVDGVIGIADSVLTRFPWKYAKNRAVVTQVFCELKPSPVRRDERVVLFAAKHFPFKNLDLFLTTTYALIVKDPDVIIHIFGDAFGTTVAADYIARHGLADRMKLHGAVPQEEVGRYLSGYRAVLLHPAAECGGTVGVESITVGAPVVCARGYGVDAFFPRGEYPHSVEYRGNGQFSEDAANEIARIFADYETCSKRVAELAQRFSFAESVEVFRRLLDKAEQT